VRIGRQHIQGNRIVTKIKKSGDEVEVSIRIHPEFRAVLDTIKHDHLNFITTERGAAQSEKAFTNWIMKRRRTLAFARIGPRTGCASPLASVLRKPVVRHPKSCLSSDIGTLLKWKLTSARRTRRSWRIAPSPRLTVQHENGHGTKIVKPTFSV
jgi:hypothetical protein